MISPGEVEIVKVKNIDEIEIGEKNHLVKPSQKLMSTSLLVLPGT